jgi:hypothetical protein
MAERKFENKEMQRRYDQSRPKAEDREEPAAGDENEKSIEDVVEEHGPADHVEVTSHHGKHKHKSEHHDAQSAKEHIDKSFGEEGAGDEREHEPEMGDGGMGGGIPTMGR